MSKKCIKCNQIHYPTRTELLPKLCVLCFNTLYNLIPDYIPREQNKKWLERKIKEWE